LDLGNYWAYTLCGLPSGFDLSLNLGLGFGSRASVHYELGSGLAFGPIDILNFVRLRSFSFLNGLSCCRVLNHQVYIFIPGFRGLGSSFT
jgi:hypothetical protein